MATVFADYDGLLSASANRPGPQPLKTAQVIRPVIPYGACAATCLSLPLSGPLRITGPAGLGVGVQLTAGLGDDEKLLQTGIWLEDRLT